MRHRLLLLLLCGTLCLITSCDESIGDDTINKVGVCVEDWFEDGGHGDFFSPDNQPVILLLVSTSESIGPQTLYMSSDEIFNTDKAASGIIFATPNADGAMILNFSHVTNQLSVNMTIPTTRLGKNLVGEDVPIGQSVTSEWGQEFTIQIAIPAGTLVADNVIVHTCLLDAPAIGPVNITEGGFTGEFVFDDGLTEEIVEVAGLYRYTQL